ncbi:MAG TPA: site-specific DNA-methyltransferase [Thermoanaerobaculia bacterium]|nr:site-specific DNA-methyltransferase [Thermoanaerobaculia bacterium]HQP88723.1 site-specific DNA-methyltransferase [Thermoanaerobaculia bacterium]
MGHAAVAPLPAAPFFQTEHGSAFQMDAVEFLQSLADESVDLVVTSPPYDGQPKYQKGDVYDRAWYRDKFMAVTAELLRVLKPDGNFVLNYRSRRYNKERGTIQYELVFWLREQGWLFAEDFIWGKPSPPPGRFNQCLKDAVEYCFQFAKSGSFRFFPENCLLPARWDKKDRERRLRLPQNHVRVNEPSGHGRIRVKAAVEMARPSNLLIAEPEFGKNPAHHPARFPVTLPDFFIRLMTSSAEDLVVDPFGGTGTTAVAAERLGRRWMVSEILPSYCETMRERLQEETRQPSLAISERVVTAP